MRFYSDHAEINEHGQRIHYTPFPFRALAKIENCLCADGKYRTVRITGYPDTAFSIPAETSYRGKTISGYVSCNNGEYVFNATGKNKALIARYDCQCNDRYCSCPNQYRSQAKISSLHDRKAYCPYCHERHGEKLQASHKE